jgi:cytochrome c oxidase assembly protein subunit 15
MIAIGGATRLTRSGLSMTEWRPIMGIIPPLSEAEWVVEFDKYTKTPEYKQLNSHFGIVEYKSIFLWEYIHRLMGRVLFLYALIPGLFLWKIKSIPIRIPIILSAYIAFQGLAGWLMVQSGLTTVPFVNPFFLATHYFLALGLLIFVFHDLCRYRPPIQIKSTSLMSFLRAIIGIVLGIQIFYGCLMSGFKAGYLSDTFPRMNNELIPGFLFNSSFAIVHLLESPLLIHWIHRWLGLFALTLIIVFVIAQLKNVAAKDRGPFIHFLGITCSQIFLGIALVKLHIPILVAITHQIIAALIVLAYFNIVFRSKT